MKKLIKLLAAAGMMAGLLAFAPAAHADDDHVGACVVDGEVTLAQGLEAGVQKEDTYTFEQTSLQCEGDGPLDDTFSVTATGGTTGLTPGSTGEDCEQGQSDGPGTLTATSDTTGVSSTAGVVVFVRVGSVVEANGSFTYDGHHVTFAAELNFTPDPVTDATKCAQAGTGTINRASLQGAAEVVATLN